MSRASDRLREFHEAFEVEREGDTKNGRTPLSREALCRQRRTLHDEEHHELDVALENLESPVYGQGDREALAAAARELADEMVLLYGTADLLGIDLDVAFDVVMDSNMAKLPACWRCKRGKLIGSQTPCPDCHGTGKGKPIKRDDGKVLKPENWREPDMSGAIIDVGPSLSPSEFMQAEVDSIDAAEDAR